MQNSIEYLNKLDKLEDLVQERNEIDTLQGEDKKKISMVEDHIRLLMDEIRKLELQIMDAN